MGSKDRKREEKKKHESRIQTYGKTIEDQEKTSWYFASESSDLVSSPEEPSLWAPTYTTKTRPIKITTIIQWGQQFLNVHLEHEPATLEQRSLRRHVSLGLELRAIEEGWRWVRVKFEEERLGVLGMVKCWVWMWELEVEERLRPWTGSHLVMTRKNDQTVNSSRLIYLLYEGDMDGFCESSFILS